jgi:hypothetical protein
MKRQTISQRWYFWNSVDPVWSYSCLISFISSVCFLGLHLGIVDGFWYLMLAMIGKASSFTPIYTGAFRTIGLCGLIGLACYTQTVLCIRMKKYHTLIWWVTFHAYIVLGVIGWEIASYFWGSKR